MKEEKPIQALRELGFSFPKDKEKIKHIFTQLSPDILFRLSLFLKNETDFFIKEANYLRSNVVETRCDICGDIKKTYFDIPDEWGWMNIGSEWTMICDQCQIKWIDKYNEIPEVVREL